MTNIRAKLCRSINCFHGVASMHSDFCTACEKTIAESLTESTTESAVESTVEAVDEVDDVIEVIDTSASEQMDIYAIHHFFNVQDPSGCLQHASRTILLSSLQNGKPNRGKILEARDILNRWLELNPVS